MKGLSTFSAIAMMVCLFSNTFGQAPSLSTQVESRLEAIKKLLTASYEQEKIVLACSETSYCEAGRNAENAAKAHRDILNGILKEYESLWDIMNKNQKDIEYPSLKAKVAEREKQDEAKIYGSDYRITKQRPIIDFVIATKKCN